MIKLFASDLDGTLLNAFHMVDAKILSAIREVTESGAHFTVATGRTFRTAGDFGFAGVDNEVVCANGSLVLDREGRVIHHGTVDAAVLEEMLLSFPQVCFECVGLERTFVTGTPEEREAGFKKDNLFRRIVLAGMRARTADDSEQPLYAQSPARILEQDICKVNARIADAGLERELHAFLAGHADKVVNTPFDPVMFEITDARVNKGASIAWLADYLGIRSEEVAVYGDGGNDLVMLEHFENSFATSNGSDDAKAAAGTVIGSCAFHAVPRHMVRTVRAQRPQAAGYTVID